MHISLTSVEVIRACAPFHYVKKCNLVTKFVLLQLLNTKLMLLDNSAVSLYKYYTVPLEVIRACAPFHYVERCDVITKFALQLYFPNDLTFNQATVFFHV